MASYLQRYLQGNCIAVWDELLALGEQVREEPIYSDARAVAQETMRRVRYNLELLIPRLRALGYFFAHDRLPDESSQSRQEREWRESLPPLQTTPPPDIAEQLDLFEREVAVLPLSLRAFYQEVGGVNFIGWYQEKPFEDDLVIDGWESEPPLEMEDFDPIFVESFRRELVEVSQDWLFFPSLFRDDTDQIFPSPFRDDGNQIATEENTPAEGESYTIFIAPDVYLKTNTSGGSPYSIRVPDGAADTLLVNEKHRTTFVKYLRLCCSYAGLPELEKMPYHPLYKKLPDLRAGILQI